METRGEMTGQKIPSGPREAFACSPWRVAKVKTTVKDLTSLVESPGPVHLQQVLLFQVMVAQEVWRIHHLWRRPPKNSDLKNKAVSDFQTIATSWRSVVSRGHLGSLAVERIFLAKDQDHRLSLSPKMVFTRETTENNQRIYFLTKKMGWA